MLSLIVISGIITVGIFTLGFILASNTSI